MKSSTRRRSPVARADALKLIQTTGERVLRCQERIAWAVAHLIANAPAGRDVLPGARPHIKHAALFFMNLLSHSCDLDLLMFFQRHPRALLAQADLIREVGGYSPRRIRSALDRLHRGGLLTWSNSPIDAGVRRFEFTPGAWEALLSRFVWLASSADGRQMLRRALAQESQTAPNGPERRSAPRERPRLTGVRNGITVVKRP